MNLHDEAIVFKEVSKTYKLYQNQWQMMMDALGFNKKNKYQEFFALKNINLNVKRGERIGIVGRNGAGKSTLLKLITGNFEPTSGSVHVHGKVQALMNTGLGFHPEFTGRENIKASLIYNGLTKKEFEAATEDVIDFVELGDFLDQPIKTYSLGMQSRLFFATATAIKPDILIVDEVLGAGDSYFSAKSAERMKNLTNSGCTLLLVSHSTAQVLQFCEKAVWIECGEIIKSGNALEIVKLYEEYSKKLELESKKRSIVNEPQTSNKQGVIQSKWLRNRILTQVLDAANISSSPEQKEIDSPNSKKRISRWDGAEGGLTITSVKFLDKNFNECHLFQSEQKLTIEVEFETSESGFYECYFVIVIFDNAGTTICRNRSQQYKLNLQANKKYSTHLIFEELLFGSGDYISSVAIFKSFGNQAGESVKYYDLLSRSFEFKINNFNDDPSLIKHPVKWQVNSHEDIVLEKELI